MEAMHYRTQTVDQRGVLLPIFTEGLSFLLEYTKDGIGRFTVVDPDGDWVTHEVLSGFLGIAAQCDRDGGMGGGKCGGGCWGEVERMRG
jgi:hypothetical protein